PVVLPILAEVEPLLAHASLLPKASLRNLAAFSLLASSFHHWTMPDGCGMRAISASHLSWHVQRKRGSLVLSLSLSPEPLLNPNARATLCPIRITRLPPTSGFSSSAAFAAASRSK